MYTCIQEFIIILEEYAHISFCIDLMSPLAVIVIKHENDLVCQLVHLYYAHSPYVCISRTCYKYSWWHQIQELRDVLLFLCVAHSPRYTY